MSSMAEHRQSLWQKGMACRHTPARTRAWQCHLCMRQRECAWRQPGNDLTENLADEGMYALEGLHALALQVASL